MTKVGIVSDSHFDNSKQIWGILAFVQVREKLWKLLFIEIPKSYTSLWIKKLSYRID